MSMLVQRKNSSPHTAKSTLEALIWVSIESYHQYGGARTGSGPWAPSSWNRGSPYTLILKAGDFQYSPCTSELRIQFIWYPSQWHWCSSGGGVTGFSFLPKDPVLALPELRWLHWYEYQWNQNINMEVQGLVLSNDNIVLKWSMPLWGHAYLFQGQVTQDIALAPLYWYFVSIDTHINDSCADLVVQGLDLFSKNKSPVTAPPNLHLHHW